LYRIVKNAALKIVSLQILLHRFIFFVPLDSPESLFKHTTPQYAANLDSFEKLSIFPISPIKRLANIVPNPDTLFICFAFSFFSPRVSSLFSKLSDSTIISFILFIRDNLL